MYELVITCLKCGAQKSTHHLPEKADLSDSEVITQAGHTPQCALRGTTNVTVERESRPDEPNVSLCTVKESASVYGEPQVSYSSTVEGGS